MFQLLESTRDCLLYKIFRLCS